MNRFYGTAVLGVLASAFAAYVIWDFTSNLERSGENPDEVSLLKDITRDGLSEIALNKAGESLKLIFVEGRCQVKEPVEDLCDPVSTENFLNHLDTLSGVELAGQGLNKDEMGLSEGRGTQISIQYKDGELAKLNIGEKNTFDGRFYVEIDQKVYITGQSTSQLTNKGLKQFRDPKIWRGKKSPKDTEEVRVSLDFEGSKENFTLVKSGDTWSLKSPQDEREIDSEKVNLWLNSLSELKASDIQLRDETKAEDPLSLNVTFVAGDQEYKIKVKKDGVAGGALVTDSETNREMVVGFPSLDGIRVPFSYFFDGKKPFQFSLEFATDLFVTQKGKTDHFKKEESKWDYKGSKENFQEDKLPDFFSKLRQLEVKAYFKPQKWFGLENSDQKRIRVVDGEGKNVLDMTWGDKIKPTQGPAKDMELRYVQIRGQKYSFGVLNSQLEELLNLNLFEAPKDEVESPEAEEDHHGHDH